MRSCLEKWADRGARTPARGFWGSVSLLNVDSAGTLVHNSTLEACQLTPVFTPRTVLCCIMALLLPVSTMPAQNAPAGGATLSPSGQVTVNNDLVHNSAALRGNETISTGRKSVAQITSPGSETLVSANTVATYLRESIGLQSGSIVITTDKGMFAQVGKLKFAPANQGLTKFEVQRNGCHVTVIAQTNKVMLPDGRVLDSDHRTSLTDEDCCAAARLDTRHVEHTPIPVSKTMPVAGGAILSPSGLVTINNDLARNSSALLGDETISTGPDSAAHITAPGSETLVAPSTVVIYSKSYIELKSGSIVITTNKGTFAQVNSLKFAPLNESALTKFEVQKDGCDVTVIARSNKVSLPDSQVLDQDRSSSYTDGDCCAAVLLDEHHVPWTLWGLVGAGGAGAAAAAAILTRGTATGTPTAVSPSRP